MSMTKKLKGLLATYWVEALESKKGGATNQAPQKDLEESTNGITDNSLYKPVFLDDMVTQVIKVEEGIMTILVGLYSKDKTSVDRCLFIRQRIDEDTPLYWTVIAEESRLLH